MDSKRQYSILKAAGHGERPTNSPHRFSDDDSHCAKSVCETIRQFVPASSVSAKRYWLSLIGLTIVMLVIGYQLRVSSSPDLFVYYSFLQDVAQDGSCTIPKLDPWDQTIKKYLSKAEPLSCRKLQSELTYMRDGRILFNKSELAASGFDLSSLRCQHRCFTRRDGDDVTLSYGEWKDLKNGSQPECEFTEVECQKTFPPISIYVNLHAQVRPLPKKQNGVDPPKNQTRVPGVVLFVLDSVSHSNWQRNLPKTLSVLRDDYDSFAFSGFTKVGDNSFPNAAAFLTGKRVMSVGYPDELPSDMSNEFFDDWPLVWKDFKQAGYVTYYAEDYPQFNLFKYLSNGFKQKPTDHYFRPYWLRLYNSFLHRRSTHLCYGNNPCHRLQLKYLSDFINAYANNTPAFALNWLTELGHDWLNQVSQGDEDIADFFKSHQDALRDSFVFVFSDHGHRFDPIRQSVIGRIEERMPFFSMHVPDWLLSEYPQLRETINGNRRQLTSFWDLYVTLRDVLDLGSTDSWRDLAEAQAVQPEERFRKVSPRGLSLLRPLPARNCETAGIPEEFCVCQQEQVVNASDPRVIKAAEQLIDHVNLMLADHADACAPLKLKEVQNAQVFLPNLRVVKNPSPKGFIFGGSDGYAGQSPSDFYINYRVTVEALPSGAMFDATIRNYISENSFRVIGDVNRINKYGNQSYCVNTQILRKYCYCMEQEDAKTDQRKP